MLNTKQIFITIEAGFIADEIIDRHAKSFKVIKCIIKELFI